MDMMSVVVFSSIYNPTCTERQYFIFMCENPKLLSHISSPLINSPHQSLSLDFSTTTHPPSPPRRSDKLTMRVSCLPWHFLITKKFLREFVSCCGCAAATAAKNDSVVLELGPSPISPRSEETISRVNSQRRYGRRKRGRVGASRCGSAAGGGEWRPSLCSIDEDHVVMIERRRKIEVGRTVKRKGSFRGGSSDRGRDQTFSDDSGIPFPVMPAFSPTPFMF